MNALEIARRNLKRLMAGSEQEAKIKQVDLALFLKRSQGWVSAFLNRKRPASVEVLDQMAQFFGLTLAELLRENGNLTPRVAPEVVRRATAEVLVEMTNEVADRVVARLAQKPINEKGDQAGMAESQPPAGFRRRAPKTPHVRRRQRATS